MSKVCKQCNTEVRKNKKWGYINLCESCDIPEKVNKSVGIMIADGKTDYHFQVVVNPTKTQASMIRAAGLAHDPRTQLRAINKVSD